MPKEGIYNLKFGGNHSMCTKPSTLTKKKGSCLNKGIVVISSAAALFALSALFLSRYVEQVHTSINDYDDRSHFIVGGISICTLR